MRHVYFRVDASSTIGLGHVSRCLVLARQLQADGCSVAFICRVLDVDIVSYASPFPVMALPPLEDVREPQVLDAAATVAAIAMRREQSIVVVDHYGLDVTWERAMRNAGHRVVCIDDFRDRHHCADVLISDSSAPFVGALNECDGASETLAGPEFAIVDPEFAASPIVHRGALPLRVLVSYGGSDPTMETIKALDAVRLLRADRSSLLGSAAVSVVLGGANRRVSEVQAASRDIEDLTVHVAPSSIAPLLRASDIFLTSGGHSMIEAVTMGRVAVVTTTAANQTLSVAALGERGVIVPLGTHETVSAKDVASGMSILAADFSTYARNVRDQRIFDDLGASRISAVLRSLPGLPG